MMGIYKKKKYAQGKRFFPDFVMEDVMAVFIYLTVFCILVFFFPEIIVATEEAPADPFSTPEHIKPEWYFLAAYQSLKVIPSELGAIILQNIAVIAFVMLPFLDRSKETNISKRPVFLFIVIFSCALLVAFTIWGKYS
ncbi:MAG: hypothetical protein V3S46_05560 [Nitrospinota bacterium]